MATTTAQKRQELLGLGAVNVNLERLATRLGLPAELGPLINESIQGGIGTVDTMAGTIELKPSWKNGVKQGLRIMDIETQGHPLDETRLSPDGINPDGVVVNIPKELKVLFPNVHSSYRCFFDLSEAVQVGYYKYFGTNNVNESQRYIMGALLIPPPLDQQPHGYRHFYRNRFLFSVGIQGVDYNRNTTLNRTRSGRERFTRPLNYVEPPFKMFRSRDVPIEARTTYTTDYMNRHYANIGYDHSRAGFNNYYQYDGNPAAEARHRNETAGLVRYIRREGTLTVQVTNELINVRNRYFGAAVMGSAVQPHYDGGIRGNANDEGVEIVLSYDKRKGLLSIYIEMVSKTREKYQATNPTTNYDLKALDNVRQIGHETRRPGPNFYEPNIPAELSRTFGGFRG